MSLTVAVRSGKIAVDRSRTNESHVFEGEDEAIAHLAYEVVNKALPVEMDPSCYNPALHGRGGFVARTFAENLRDSVDDLRRSMRMTH